MKKSLYLVAPAAPPGVRGPELVCELELTADVCREFLRLHALYRAARAAADGVSELAAWAPAAWSAGPTADDGLLRAQGFAVFARPALGPQATTVTSTLDQAAFADDAVRLRGFVRAAWQETEPVPIAVFRTALARLEAR